MTSTPVSLCSTVDLDVTPYGLQQQEQIFDVETPAFIDSHTELPRDLFEELLVCGQQARARGCHVAVYDEHSGRDGLVLLDLCAFG